MLDDAATFEARLEMRARAVDHKLRDLLGGHIMPGEVRRPEGLLAAMRHGVLNGGKRLRPFLVMESSSLFDVDEASALRVAAAIECVHSYSLIHDDLPAMDNDDMRRGQPTVHRAFDEATAILAGDSLLTLAFDIVANEATGLDAERRAALVVAMARASGIGGMAGGQALDLDAQHSQLSESGIIELQAMKTGALIRFACEAGAIAAGAPSAERERLGEFGSAIGLAFQLADDLLDVTADAQSLGKATGKDAAAGKATLVALYGVEWARQQLAGLVDQAQDLLEVYGARGEILKATARFVADRRS